MEENKVNTYEISFLLNLAEDARFIKNHLSVVKAEIVSEGNIYPMNFAYPIDGKKSGYFGYIHFKLSTSDTQRLNNSLGLDKNVIRFLIITPPYKKPVSRRMDVSSERPPKKYGSKDLSNEALEEKLSALQGK